MPESIRIVGVFLLSVLLTFTASTQTIYDSVFISKAQALEDLGRMDKVIERNYKPFDLILVKQDYKSNLDKLKENLPDEISLRQFRIEIIKVIDAFREAHFKVGIEHPTKSKRELRKSQKANRSIPKMLPFDLSLHGDVFRVHYDYRPDSLQSVKIDSITMIGGRSVDDLLTDLSQYTSADVDSDILEKRFMTHRLAPAIRSMLRPLFQDSVSIGFIKNGKHQDKWIKYIKRKSKSDFKRIEMIDSISTCIVRMERFRSLAYVNDSTKYRDIQKVGLDSIAHFNPDNLVFDLRQNGGGSAKYCRRWLSGLLDQGDKIYASNAIGLVGIPFLFATRFRLGVKPKFYRKAKSKDNGFNGNVYVIIDEGSFSASMIFARALQVNNRAIIIGQPTGQKSFGTHAGYYKNVKLKHSGVIVNIPQIYFKMDDRPLNELKYEGVQPDIFLPYDLDADNNETYDATMEYVLDVINEKRLTRD